MRFRFFGQYLHLSIGLLAAVDCVLFAAAFLFAAGIRFSGGLPSIEASAGPIWHRLVIFIPVMILCLLAFGLYSARQRARTFGIFLRVVSAIAIGSAAVAVLFYLIPDVAVGRGILASAAILSVALISLSRAVFARYADEELFKRRILVYGCGQRASAVAQLRRRADRRGFVLIGFVKPHGEGCTVPPERTLDAANGLLPLVEQHDIDEVIVAMDDRRRAFPIRDLLECRLAGVEVTELLTFLERETGRVRIDALNPSWMIFGNGFRRDPVRLFSSRALDIIASSLILAMTWPFMLVTTLAIKVEDGWDAPVLYGQERVGLGGATFRLLKFRSMRTDAEGDGQARWAERNDPRITCVGRVIRKLRIDELPQILNVLRGHMSFVGPRPERPEFVRELAEKVPYYVQRHCVRPGITGWAQLCYQYGSSAQDALEKLQYDLYYIKNNSLFFDLAILVQTAEVVFMGKGAR
ncbi:MAG TPA: TIGR03013 family XrtA/PEP-CTERM system glycosyltransferase [Steroidobacteraceae bacterium]|nr:TIGR03013 family XrtA/PEP-CTERM system glycosyltransferase [Steroidobacteraceae bacterium]